MRTLIIKSKDPMINDNLLGITKAFHYSKAPIAYWDMSAPAFDVFAEFKPDVVVSDKDNNDRAYLKCLDKYGPKVIASHNVPLTADVFVYAKYNLAAKELVSDLSAMVSYNESEYDKLREYERTNKVFKVFSNFQRRWDSYCGPIVPDLKPLIMNSAKLYIATNILDALNCGVMGKQMINLSALENRYTNRDYILAQRTCFHGAKAIDKRFDVDKLKDFIYDRN